MRILFINYEYPPVGGGAATATAAIARALVDLGHAVVILTGKFKRLPEVAKYRSSSLKFTGRGAS